MAHGSNSQPNLAVVPLFPLPNVVLFPQAVLPLHIFEERYKAMTTDALEGSRKIAMALLTPGWEKNYYGKPSIEPVICVGEILTHELLDEGKYNFLLRGQYRATIIREIAGHPYRLAEVAPLPEIKSTDNDLDDHRIHLTELLACSEMSRLAGIEQFRELAAGPLPVPDLVDLLSFHLLDGIPLKQSLLSDANVEGRVKRAILALNQLRESLPLPRPKIPRNPSMN